MKVVYVPEVPGGRPPPPLCGWAFHVEDGLWIKENFKTSAALFSRPQTMAEYQVEFFQMHTLSFFEGKFSF